MLTVPSCGCIDKDDLYMPIVWQNLVSDETVSLRHAVALCFETSLYYVFRIILLRPFRK